MIKDIGWTFKFSSEIHFRIFQFLIRSLRIDLLAFIFEYFPNLLQIFKQLEGLNSDDIFRGNGGNGGKQKTSRDKKQWRVISITTLIKIQMKSLKALRAGWIIITELSAFLVPRGHLSLACLSSPHFTDTRKRNYI